MPMRSAFWALLLSSFASWAVPANAQIHLPYVPSFQLGVGYQYQRYGAFGRSFHNNGANETFAVHVADPLTSADWLISGDLEATLAAGFGGQTLEFLDSAQNHYLSEWGPTLLSKAGRGWYLGLICCWVRNIFDLRKPLP
jgi:hypothetical protein